MGRVISRDRMNGSRFNLTIIGIDLCIINQLLRFIKTVAIPLCIKLGSSWKSLSIIYDRHGRNFNQTFKWGFAKTRRISYRKRVTWPRVTRTSASSYFSILCWENRVVIAKITRRNILSWSSISCLQFEREVWKFRGKFVIFSRLCLIHFWKLVFPVFSMWFFFFLFKSRMKAVIENRYYN